MENWIQACNLELTAHKALERLAGVKGNSQHLKRNCPLQAGVAQ